MKEKINIAEILKNKPQGTKLYSILSDGECFLNEASEDSIYIDIDNRKRFWCFTVYGSTHSFPNGCVLLFPSREMRDWRKFAWKNGDVLVNSSGFKLFFDRWANDYYTRFFGKVNLLEDSFSYETEKYTLASKEETLDTFEIEKPEFKDGDIVYMGNAWNEYIGIIKNRTSGNQIETYAHCHKDSKEEAVLGLWLNKNDSDELRLATNSENQQLFDALAKKGKDWNVEKKMIVDLKQKVELKPFDKVLVRHQKTEEWSANIFSHTDKTDEYLDYICVNGRWEFCIPYIGNEHLLGTTKDVEG